MPGLGVLVRFLVYLLAILNSFIDNSITRSIDIVHASRYVTQASGQQLNLGVYAFSHTQAARTRQSSWHVRLVESLSLDARPNNAAEE